MTRPSTGTSKTVRGTDGPTSLQRQSDRWRQPQVLEAGDLIVVSVTSHEAGVEVTPGQIGEVEDDEQPDNDAGPQHRP